MSRVDRERVKELLSQAAELPSDKRISFIEQAAGADRAVAAEALELLRTLDDSAFMNAPTVLPAPAAPTAASDGDTRLRPALLEGAGTRIGRYKLLQSIGEGGFGAVFMAEQTEPVVRRVALKIIKAGMDTRQVIARFEAERQALALMDHPNIARVLDGGATESGRPFFVMELVKGEPITKYCDREQLPVRARLELFRAVCHAVQHAHQKGIIHRDIKPSNVLVTVADGQPLPKVIDFGIAKATATRLTDKTLFTELHQLIGTPEYMSPEQAEPASADIDTRTDVYSLGVLLYELLTGTTPFDARKLLSAGLHHLIRTIREEEPARPSMRLAGLRDSSARVTLELDARGEAPGSSAMEIARLRRTQPPHLARALRGDLDWIVLKCLEKDRRRRYETAAALAEDIHRYLDRQPVLATPPSAGYRFRKFVQRNRGVVLAASLVTTALLIGLAGTSAGLAWALRERGRARDEAANARRSADETRQVAAFQARMLADIDVEAMGRGLKERLRDQVRAALEREWVGEFPDRRKRNPEEVEAQLAAYDTLASPVLGADVARHVVDEYVLQNAAAAIDTRFVGQPQVQAQLDNAIGQTYVALGMFDAAEPCFRAALKLRALHPDRDVVESLNNLANLLRDKGEYAEAESLLQEALSEARRWFGDQSAQVALVLHNFAQLMVSKRDLDTAEAYAQQSLALRRQLPALSGPPFSTVLLGLAEVFRAKGEFQAAESAVREALESRRTLHGGESVEVAEALNNLAMVLRANRRNTEAERYLVEALDLMKEGLGEEHPRVATTMNNLAMVRMAQGDNRDAQPLLRETLALRRRLLGDVHPEVADSLSNLAMSLRRDGQYAAAEPLYREALALRRRTLGDEHADVASSLNNLGLVLKSMGRYAEAEPLYREGLELMRRAMGPDDSRVADALFNLGSLLRAEGDLDKAESYYHEALDLRRRVLGPDHPDVAQSLTKLAELRRTQRRYSDAETLYREALAILDKRQPDSVVEAASIRTQLASSLLREALDAATADDARLPKLRDAESELLAAWRVIAQHPGVPRSYAEPLLLRLAEVYEALDAAEPEAGHGATAAEWRAKLDAFRAAAR